MKIDGIWQRNSIKNKNASIENDKMTSLSFQHDNLKGTKKKHSAIDAWKSPYRTKKGAIIICSLHRCRSKEISK